MAVKYTNNASALLTSGINNSVTTIEVDNVSLFPVISSPDYAYMTLVATGTLEIVKVTDITGTTLTCVRAQDGTSAAAFSTGDRIELRLTTAMLVDALQETITDAETHADAAADSAAAALLSEGSADTDATQTAADRVQTGLDVIATAADVVSTGNDVIATNADVVLTAADVIAADAARVAAEAAAAGIFWKEPVVVATINDITLSGEQTIDAIAIVTGDRVLVKSQTASEENGIYLAAAGAWSRATPLDTWDEHVGATVLTTQGSTNQDTSWICTVDPGGTLETTAITWAAFGSIATSITVDNFTDGVDYTSGTSTQITLTADPGSEENLQISFDGDTQHHNTFTVSGVTVTFDAAIPLGIQDIEARIGTTLGIGTPADGTVTPAKIAANAVETAKINAGAVTGPKLGGGVIPASTGFALTDEDAGTKTTGTFTPDEADGNFQYAINGGAHALAPPVNSCSLVIQYTNNASAGAIDTSAFTLVDGDTISTTDGDDFFLFITKSNSLSLLSVKALQ